MNNQMETITEDGEILPALPQDMSLAMGLARAEIDQQIATARAYPRSIKRATDAIFTLATLDEQTAEECTYALPRGGKPITGPSIRLAEIIAQSWGNNRVAARVVHVDRTEKFVEAEGVYHDLETNSAAMARVRRRISDKNGKLLSDDMIIVTGNAACSIAKRNAILAGVPKPVWRQAEDAVRKVVAGTIETLGVKREKSIKAFAHYGVKPEQIYASLGLTGADDIGVEHIPILRGMYAALKNGEATVEEMFDPRRNGSPNGGFTPVKSPLSDDPVGAGGNVEKAGEQAARAQDTVPEAPLEGVAQEAHVVPVQNESAGGAGEPTASDLGYAARKAGKSSKTNPYPDPGASGDDWHDGWMRANEEMKGVK